MGKKKVGELVEVTGYIPQEMYEMLKPYAEPGLKRWESALLRRIIREWLERKKREEVAGSGGKPDPWADLPIPAPKGEPGDLKHAPPKK